MSVLQGILLGVLQGIAEIMFDSYAGHMARRYCSGRIGGMTKEINNWV